MMFPPGGVLIQKNVAMMASPLWGLVGLNPLRSTDGLQGAQAKPSPNVPFTWSSAMGSAAAVANRGALTARRPGSSDSLQPTASNAAPTRAGRTWDLARWAITPHQTGKLRARPDGGCGQPVACPQLRLVYGFSHRAKYASCAWRMSIWLCWLYAAPWRPGGYSRRSTSLPALASAVSSCMVFCGWTLSSIIEWMRSRCQPSLSAGVNAAALS